MSGGGNLRNVVNAASLARALEDTGRVLQGLALVLSQSARQDRERFLQSSYSLYKNNRNSFPTFPSANFNSPHSSSSSSSSSSPSTSSSVSPSLPSSTPSSSVLTSSFAGGSNNAGNSSAPNEQHHGYNPASNPVASLLQSAASIASSLALPHLPHLFPTDSNNSSSSSSFNPSYSSSSASFPSGFSSSSSPHQSHQSSVQPPSTSDLISVANSLANSASSLANDAARLVSQTLQQAGANNLAAGVDASADTVKKIMAGYSSNGRENLQSEGDPQRLDDQPYPYHRQDGQPNQSPPASQFQSSSGPSQYTAPFEQLQQLVQPVATSIHSHLPSSLKSAANTAANLVQNAASNISSPLVNNPFASKLQPTPPIIVGPIDPSAATPAASVSSSVGSYPSVIVNESYHPAISIGPDFIGRRTTVDPKEMDLQNTETTKHVATPFSPQVQKPGVELSGISSPSENVVPEVVPLERMTTSGVKVEPIPAPQQVLDVSATSNVVHPASSSVSQTVPSSASPPSSSSPSSLPSSNPKFVPRERSVPSTPLGRIVGFAGIGLRMVTGTVMDVTKRVFAGGSTDAATPNASTAGPKNPVEVFAGEANKAATAAMETVQGVAKGVNDVLYGAAFQSPDQLRKHEENREPRRQHQLQDEHVGVIQQQNQKHFDQLKREQQQQEPVQQPLHQQTSGTPSSTFTSASTSNSATSSSRAASRPHLLSSFMSEANTERLAEGLCRMRGAALKVGQMLSIQDESLLPPQLQQVLDRVRDGADVMPRAQLERALVTELGPDWQSKLASFEFVPIAAASIGQVHRGVLHDGRKIVMKVQYPGVAESINSDVNNVKMLVRVFNVLPKGMYIDDTMKAAKEELSIECDYHHEAQCQMTFQNLLKTSASPVLQSRLHVPSVIPSLSTKRVLTSEFVEGVPIDKLAVGSGSGFELSQQQRNEVAHTLLALCLTELFQFRFMQTDPNWSNFLYNTQTQVIHLIDFGASRAYDKLFVDEYLRMVYACAERDRDAVIQHSIKLGFLTGDESREMLNAHVEAGFIVGEPFSKEAGEYDFEKGNISGRVSPLASVMLKLRLTPPPKEAYTLHRKLSGAFLTCKKLQAKINCRDQFMELYNSYPFGEEKRDDEVARQVKVNREGKIIKRDAKVAQSFT